MRYVYAVLLILFSGAALADDSARYIEAAKKEMLGTVPYPDSTQFRDLFFHRKRIPPDSRMEPVVCGKVNTKALSGEYMGFHHFIWLQAGSVILHNPHDPTYEDSVWKATVGKLWSKYCDE